jgi:hypothetical protein
MEEDDVDVSNLHSNASNFTYENNAKMEIGTIRTALDKEREKGELHLLRDNALNVQSKDVFTQDFYSSN